MVSAKIYTRVTYRLRDAAPYTAYNNKQVFEVYYAARRDLLDAIAKLVSTDCMPNVEYKRRVTRIDTWFEYKVATVQAQLTYNKLVGT